MKRLILIFIALSFSTNVALATCDLTRYRWDCDLPARVKPASTAPALVYCGNTPVYISKAHYDELTRYQRANVNMSLTVNDEFLEGPCIPAER